MNNNSDDGTLFKLIGFGLLVYAGVQVVKSVVAAITALLMGLVNIALVAGGILALFFVYRYITDKQYGETRNLQQIEKLERQRKQYTARLPKHLRQEADQYYRDKQSEFFNPTPRSRADVILEKTGQVFNTFKRKGSGNEATRGCLKSRKK